MINIKSQKGSVTLFVITTCLFFIVAVTTVGMHMQAKKTAVDREYKQVKASYEKDLANAESIYDKLDSLNNLEVTFSDININKNAKQINLKAILNTQGLDVKTLKYGWYYSESELGENAEETLTSNISNWSYLEDINGENEFYLTRNYAQNERIGYHYLCFVANNNVIYGIVEPVKKLDYIESTGTQWIDTLWAPPIDAGIEFDIQLTENEKTRQEVGHGASLFSSGYCSPENEDYVFEANIGENTGLHNCVYYWVDEKYKVGDVIYRMSYSNITQRSVMSVRSGIAIFQGVNCTIATRTTANQSSLNLLYWYKDGEDYPMDRYNVKIYSCKLYEGDTLVKNLVPILDEDGIPCLYDKIGNEYYYNQGTGQFEYAE